MSADRSNQSGSASRNVGGRGSMANQQANAMRAWFIWITEQGASDWSSMWRDICSRRQMDQGRLERYNTLLAHLINIILIGTPAAQDYLGHICRCLGQALYDYMKRAADAEVVARRAEAARQAQLSDMQGRYDWVLQQNPSDWDAILARVASGKGVPRANLRQYNKFKDYIKLLNSINRQGEANQGTAATYLFYLRQRMGLLYDYIQDNL